MIRYNFCILAPPINCKWSPFGEWTGCTATCGAGLKQRSRTVLQEAINDGRECVGCRVEIEICNVQECPLKGELCNLFNRRSLLIFPEMMSKYIFKLIHVVSGMWATWEQWTQCTDACGIGERIRKRDCSNPAPENNGEYCSGPRSEKEYCLSAQSDCKSAPGKLTNLCCHYELDEKFF